MWPKHLVAPDGEVVVADSLIEWLYFKSDWAVYKRCEAGWPLWLVKCYGYLIGQHIWLWLQSRPWRYW